MRLLGVEDVLDASGRAREARRTAARCRRADSAGRPRPGASAGASGCRRHGPAGSGARACATPSRSSGAPSRRRRLNSTAVSLLAQARDLVRHAVLAHRRPEAVELVPTSQLTMNPPYDRPSTPSRSGSASPSADRVVDRGVDVRRVDAAPVAELRPDPVAAVAGGAADVRQDHPVAAGAEQHDLDGRCRRPRPERAAVDHRRSSGAAASEASAGRRDPGLDRATRPRCLDEIASPATRVLGAQRLPRRGADRRAGCPPVRAGRRSSRAPSAGCPTRARSVTRDAVGAAGRGATARLCAAKSPSASGAGAPTGRPVAGSTSNRHGVDRPRSETSATIVPASSQHGVFRDDGGPAVQVRVDPVPIGRSKSGASGHGGPEPSARPDDELGARVIERAGSTITPTAAIQRPSGDHAGECRGRRARAPRAALDRRPAAASPTGSTAQIEVRGCRSASAWRSAANAIDRAVRRPRDPARAPVAARHLANARAGAGPRRRARAASDRRGRSRRSASRSG